jgi:hypothetical protein
MPMCSVHVWEMQILQWHAFHSSDADGGQSHVPVHLWNFLHGPAAPARHGTELRHRHMGREATTPLVNVHPCCRQMLPHMLRQAPQGVFSTVWHHIQVQDLRTCELCLQLWCSCQEFAQHLLLCSVIQSQATCHILVCFPYHMETGCMVTLWLKCLRPARDSWNGSSSPAGEASCNAATASQQSCRRSSATHSNLMQPAVKRRHNEQQTAIYRAASKLKKGGRPSGISVCSGERRTSGEVHDAERDVGGACGDAGALQRRGVGRQRLLHRGQRRHHIWFLNTQEPVSRACRCCLGASRVVSPTPLLTAMHIIAHYGHNVAL